VQAEVQSVPSVAPINAWADKVTNGMIKQVVPPGLPFNLIITNAVYFKGMWEYAFEKSATRKQDFNAVTSSGERKVWRGMQWPVCMDWQTSICACAHKLCLEDTPLEDATHAILPYLQWRWSVCTTATCNQLYRDCNC
jgi:hypothetical protein